MAPIQTASLSLHSLVRLPNTVYRIFMVKVYQKISSLGEIVESCKNF